MSRQSSIVPQKVSLTVGISSRALFNLDESHRIFEEQGTAAYKAYQIEREKEPLDPGVGFPLVQKLLRINEVLGEEADIEVILISRNSADTGLRVFHSIQKYRLNISRAAFCGGRSAHRYLHSFGVNLFLSTNSQDVAGALEAGVAAATVLPGASVGREPNADRLREGKGSAELHIAFDGDSVLFDHEAELVYQQQGLEAFKDTESSKAEQPMGGGPLLPFMAQLQSIQRKMGTESEAERSLIRTALVTARAMPAHERAIRTLRHWDISLDECLFLGGNDKKDFLIAFGADFFFDDKREICDSTAEGVPTGHVPVLATGEGGKK